MCYCSEKEEHVLGLMRPVSKHRGVESGGSGCVGALKKEVDRYRGRWGSVGAC